MSARSIDWVIISRFDRPIGAIGFIGNQAAIVTAFYDDRDGNKDGEVSIGERVVSMISPISIEGSAVVEVAMAARTDMDIVMRDAGFAQEAAQMFVHFAAGLVADGVYAAYFSRGIKMASAAVAKQIGGGMVREFVIRKGMEKAVKELYEAATP